MLAGFVLFGFWGENAFGDEVDPRAVIGGAEDTLDVCRFACFGLDDVGEHFRSHFVAVEIGLARFSKTCFRLGAFDEPRGIGEVDNRVVRRGGPEDAVAADFVRAAVGGVELDRFGAVDPHQQPAPSRRKGKVRPVGPDHPAAVSGDRMAQHRLAGLAFFSAAHAEGGEGAGVHRFRLAGQHVDHVDLAFVEFVEVVAVVAFGRLRGTGVRGAGAEEDARAVCARPPVGEAVAKLVFGIGLFRSEAANRAVRFAQIEVFAFCRAARGEGGFPGLEDAEAQVGAEAEVGGDEVFGLETEGRDVLRLPAPWSPLREVLTRRRRAFAVAEGGPGGVGDRFAVAGAGLDEHRGGIEEPPAVGCPADFGGVLLRRGDQLPAAIVGQRFDRGAKGVESRDRAEDPGFAFQFEEEVGGVDAEAIGGGWAQAFDELGPGREAFAAAELEFFFCIGVGSLGRVVEAVFWAQFFDVFEVGCFLDVFEVTGGGDAQRVDLGVQRRLFGSDARSGGGADFDCLQRGEGSLFAGGGAIGVGGDHAAAVFGFRFDFGYAFCFVQVEVRADRFALGGFARVVEAVSGTQFLDVFEVGRFLDVIEVDGRVFALGVYFGNEGDVGVAVFGDWAGFGEDGRG